MNKEDLDFRRDMLADIYCWLEGYTQDRKCFIEEKHILALKNTIGDIKKEIGEIKSD